MALKRRCLVFQVDKTQAEAHTIKQTVKNGLDTEEILASRSIISIFPAIAVEMLTDHLVMHRPDQLPPSEVVYRVREGRSRCKAHSCMYTASKVASYSSGIAQ